MNFLAAPPKKARHGARARTVSATHGVFECTKAIPHLTKAASCDPARRDELIGTMAGTIAAKAASLLGSEPLKIDRAWAATFGSSPDGLPAIGRAANMTKVWLAAGYGGNGIAFAPLAAELLSGALVGRAETDLACFAPYRFGSDR